MSGIIVAFAILLQIGLFRSSDYVYFMGAQFAYVLLFSLLAYNTLGWVRVASILGAVLCLIKGYDIYRKYNTVLQYSDFIILAAATAWIFYIYITHRKKNNAGK